MVTQRTKSETVIRQFYVIDEEKKKNNELSSVLYDLQNFIDGFKVLIKFFNLLNICAQYISAT